MDPQKITLDPKLKEAYDSVMGTKVPPLSQPPTNLQVPQSTSQKATGSSIAWHVSGPQIISQPPASFPQPQPSLGLHSPLPVTKIVAYHSSDQNTQQKKQVQGKKWRLRWVLAVFAIAAFFIGYAIFWIKVFGIKLPILSNFF